MTDRTGIIANLEDLLASGRDDPMLRFGLGSAYFNAKAFEDAVPHLEACIDQDPEYSAAYKLLGKALFRTGRHAEAKAVFENGLPVAERRGDKQTVREMRAFLNKIAKSRDR